MMMNWILKVLKSLMVIRIDISGGTSLKVVPVSYTVRTNNYE